MSACRRRHQTATSCWGDSALVVSVDGKGVARPRQVRFVESNESEPLMKCRDDQTASKPRRSDGCGMRWGLPCVGPALCPTGARHTDGENANQASMRNRRTRRPDAKGAAQVEDTTRARVPMRGTGAEVFVVGLKVL